MDEVEYVFGTLDIRLDTTWRFEDRKLSEQMMSYWTNFAKTGNPNGPGLPEYLAYGANNAMIHFDAITTAGSDKQHDRLEFLVKNMPPPVRLPAIMTRTTRSWARSGTFRM